MDHRGHGKSMREVEDHTIVHIGLFSRYVKDLHRFVKTVVKPMAKYLSVAACCALVVGAAYGIHTLHPDKTVSEEEDMTTTDVADDGAQFLFPMRWDLPLKRSENCHLP